MEFKLGDKVKIIGNEYDSVNHVGDVGIITQITEDDKDGLNYRVHVLGRKFYGEENIVNWHTKYEIKLYKTKP